MTLATLKMKGLDWDDVKIAVGGEHPAIVVLKDRTSVADLHTTLLHALFDNEDDPLTLTIDGNFHGLSSNKIHATSDLPTLRVILICKERHCNRQSFFPPSLTCQEDGFILKRHP